MTEQLIHFTIDGKDIAAKNGESILNAAKRHGVDIPHLCYKDGYRADGNCRACVVEIKGERVLAPSCCRNATAGMEVQAESPRAIKSQKMVLEMLLSDMPDQGYKWNDSAQDEIPKDIQAIGQHGELSAWADEMDVVVRPELRAIGRMTGKDAASHTSSWSDSSHPAMLVNLDACIQCTRCVRACREEQVNDVIGYAMRGSHSKIVFDLDDPMQESTCVACGECVQACPTGALMPKTLVGSQKVDREVDSVCPFCGVGCQITYKVKDEKIVAVDGRDGPANHDRLCVKGRFGFDYVDHAGRLTKPLIRKAGVAKDPAILDKQGISISDVFREATWEEALDFAAGGFMKLKAQYGLKALSGFGSAKGSNEEAYLFQKLVRTGFGSNNVDHCTRLCHASSVAALLEGVGSGAVSNQVNDVSNSELVLVIGSNPTANHPVAATWMKNAAKNGTKIVLADPRVTDIGKHAWRTLQFKADSDVAMLNAMIHTVIEEGLVNKAFIRDRASNFEALVENVKGYSPELMAPICGIPAETLREVARAFAKAKSAMILWGMGVSQHVHGTDNARCLIALVSVTGQIGKPGSGLHPLRGQNNVQGASDAGLIPMMFPNYQRVDDPAVHAWFENFWDTKLDNKPGLTVVETMNAALFEDSHPAKIHGMFVEGENPAMSDPDLNHARHAMAELKHFVVQDIFMTETAWLADVILPASAWPEKTGTVSNTDRMVQMGKQAILPPGEARQDLWILQQIARRMGLNWTYMSEASFAGDGFADQSGAANVYEEMRQAMHAVISGITWERLERDSSVTYPCLTAEDPGSPTVFIDDFPTADGRVKLVPADIIPANERPDAEYPMVLITGRQLEHWHTGSMTRRATVLDAIEPMATVSMNRAEMAKQGLQAGDVVTIQSRRGEIAIHVREDDGTPTGVVFIPFAYYEAAANKLTNSAYDPVAKIPEFKYCAVRVAKGGDMTNEFGFHTNAMESLAVA
jgi:formate dehydrogenase major subunit